MTDISEIDSNSINKWNFININDLISTIESSKYIEREYIGGWGAKKSYIYGCYEKLLEIASDSLWIELSYSKSPVMRYYAYKALLSKESSEFPAVRNRLIRDTSPVCTYSCDIIDCLLTLGELLLIEERSGANIDCEGVPLVVNSMARQLKKS